MNKAKQAVYAMDLYRLDPVEPFPRSVTAPWTVRCRGCQRLSRLRLIDVITRHRGCRLCPPERLPAYRPPPLPELLAAFATSG